MRSIAKKRKQQFSYLPTSIKTVVKMDFAVGGFYLSVIRFLGVFPKLKNQEIVNCLNFNQNLYSNESN
jgi:hypothetical protein